VLYGWWAWFIILRESHRPLDGTSLWSDGRGNLQLINSTEQVSQNCPIYTCLSFKTYML
jgi:hypothetical protein